MHGKTSKFLIMPFENFEKQIVINWKFLHSREISGLFDAIKLAFRIALIYIFQFQSLSFSLLAARKAPF